MTIPNTVLPITMMDSKLDSLIFDLPSNLEAGEPPEARGLSRDQVRLMVSYQSDDAIETHRISRPARRTTLRAT